MCKEVTIKVVHSYTIVESIACTCSNGPRSCIAVECLAFYPAIQVAPFTLCSSWTERSALAAARRCADRPL